MRKLCVLLTDPMKVLYEKGEIKERYYNPEDFFDEIHMISFCDTDIDAQKVRVIGGNAGLFIHTIGYLNFLTLVKSFRRVYILIRNIKPDAIRAYSPSIKGCISVIIGRLLKIPVVISLHANMDEQRKYDRRIILKIRELLEHLSIKLADVVICVTYHVRDYALKHGARYAEVIYNGVDLLQFNDSQRSSLFARDTVLCVGRLDKQKYQECLIRAITNLDVDLVLIGSGTELNKYQQLVKKLDLQNRVKFIKSIPHNQIHNYYASAKIFAIATHYEGFCIPVIEAMASGIPVVASNILPIKEIILDAGLLADNTPEDFSKKIRMLLDNQILYNDFSQKGRNRAKVFDSVLLIEKKERNIYESICRL